ncbi:MAG: ubiquinol-cytochrome c reductase cytochrome b subunit, partial [Candidatus Nanopelagicales bacterium]
QITIAFRVLIFVVPVFVFWLTKRIALSLQRRDVDRLLHGNESGRLLRLPHGEFIEVHSPLNERDRARLSANPGLAPIEAPPATDEAGCPTPGLRSKRLQARVSHFFYGDRIVPPTSEEIEAAQAHLESGHAPHGELPGH